MPGSLCHGTGGRSMHGTVADVTSRPRNGGRRGSGRRAGETGCEDSYPHMRKAFAQVPGAPQRDARPAARTDRGEARIVDPGGVHAAQRRPGIPGAGRRRKAPAWRPRRGAVTCSVGTTRCARVVDGGLLRERLPGGPLGPRGLQRPLEVDRGRHTVPDVPASRPAHTARQERPLGRHRREPLVPQHDGDLRELLKGADESLGPPGRGPDRPVEAAGETDDDSLGEVIAAQACDLRSIFLQGPVGDGLEGRRDRSRRVAHGHADAAAAEVHAEDAAHDTSGTRPRASRTMWGRSANAASRRPGAPLPPWASSARPPPRVPRRRLRRSSTRVASPPRAIAPGVATTTSSSRPLVAAAATTTPDGSRVLSWSPRTRKVAWSAPGTVTPTTVIPSTSWASFRTASTSTVAGAGGRSPPLLRSRSARTRSGTSPGEAWSSSATRRSVLAASWARRTAALPVTASMRRTPAPTDPSDVIRKRPISDVFATWVPPQSSRL